MSATCDRKETAIVVHPGRMGGQPTIGHSRLTADLIASSYWDLGYDETIYLWDYLDRDDVLVACWYQARFGPRKWRQRWKDWLDVADIALWSPGNHDGEIPLPPRERDT